MHDDPPSPPSMDPGSHPPSSKPRRLPPPCWSQEETVAMIEAYRDKWYSLRRGNLKAPHWQEVADEVSRHCPTASPAKTAMQCRHKMEKLRKRYRAELQRARSLPAGRFVSSWPHFNHMDAMEKGPGALDEPDSEDDAMEEEEEEEEEDEEEEEEEEGLFEGIAPTSRSGYGLSGNRFGRETPDTGKSGGGSRIRIPTAVSIAQPGIDFMRKFDRSFGSGSSAGFNNANSSSGSRFGVKLGRGYGGGAPVPVGIVGSGKRDRDPVEEMVGAIRGLGDGFARMERMKMETAREMETMRMEMEMKRTEMILESQQRIVDAFTKAAASASEKAAAARKPKVARRMPSPENNF